MILILYSVLTEFATVGPFVLNASKGQYKYWVTQYITFGLLGSLQAVNLFWLYLILRIAKNYVWQKQITDLRSDDEEEDDTGDERAAAKIRVNHSRQQRLADDLHHGADRQHLGNTERLRRRSSRQRTANLTSEIA